MRPLTLLVGILLLPLWLLSCRDEGPKVVRTRSGPAQPSDEQPRDSRTPGGPLGSAGQPAVREIDVGIAGDDESSERVLLNLQPQTALRVSLYRSRVRQQQQTLVNSLLIDIGSEDYSLQKIDLLKNGRDEIVIIGTPRSGEGVAAYVIALSPTSGLLQLAFELSTPPGGTIDVDWDAQGFYLLMHRPDLSGEEIVHSYRWSTAQRRFVASRIQQSQPHKIGDERMRRIYNREKGFMLSSLDGLWEWGKNSEQEKALLNFSTKQNSMEIYLSSTNGASFLPQEHAIERFTIEGNAFFYQGRISLDLTNSYLDGVRRWLSITYLSYDHIVIASSVEEPWLGEYRRVEQKQDVVNQLALSQYVTPESLDGYFVGDQIHFDFNEGRLTLTEGSNTYRGFYLFFLWQGIHILQYHAVNKEKQQEKTGLYRVGLDTVKQANSGRRQLALIPLFSSGEDEPPVLRLRQQPRSGEPAATSP